MTFLVFAEDILQQSRMSQHGEMGQGVCVCVTIILKTTPQEGGELHHFSLFCVCVGCVCVRCSQPIPEEKNHATGLKGNKIKSLSV